MAAQSITRASVLVDTYLGRKLAVRKYTSSVGGQVATYINGELLGIVAGSVQSVGAKELESLRRWIDMADERRLTEPDAYPEHFYIGAKAA